MRQRLVRSAWILAGIALGCARPRTEATSTATATTTATTTATATATATATTTTTATMDAGPREAGPFEIPFLGKRAVYFAISTSRSVPQRLIANLHGVCNPPGYACGYWVHAASERGFLVCPTGNATCGPGQYNAPTWTESFERMDDDLERAIEAVRAAYPSEVTRDGAVLTDFSRGGYAAVRIAALHPGRWPYLVLNEADVALSVPSLRAAGVRAVALIAGEIGGEVAGERRTASALAKQGYPARLWVMPKAGHFYSANIDQIMGEAVDWVVANGERGDAGPG